MPHKSAPSCDIEVNSFLSLIGGYVHVGVVTLALAFLFIIIVIVFVVVYKMSV
jgi:hypothetical protein